MIVSTLPDPEQHALWPGIRALLKRGADFGGVIDWEPEHVVWIVIEDRQIIAALSSRLIEDDHELAEVFNIGGHRAAEWLPDADEHISMWARLCGANKVQARGRMGWGRLSQPLGWAKVGQDGKTVFYQKAL